MLINSTFSEALLQVHPVSSRAVIHQVDARFRYAANAFMDKTDVLSKPVNEIIEVKKGKSKKKPLSSLWTPVDLLEDAEIASELWWTTLMNIVGKVWKSLSEVLRQNLFWGEALNLIRYCSLLGFNDLFIMGCSSFWTILV